MKELNEKEMSNIEGGAISWGIIAAVAAIVTFVIGVIDGYIPQ